jgi:hypothetical protein
VRLRIVAAVAVAVVVALAASAAADDSVYQVDGEADAGASDPKKIALDDAFAAAVREALRDLVASADLKARKADLDREVVGRSRLWVVNYKVTEDATEGDLRRLKVNVRIARDKLVGRLGELSIPVRVDDTPTPIPTATRRATVLLRVTTPRGVVASFGAGAERDAPGLAAIGAAAAAAGWQVVSAPTAGPAARRDGELPLDDESARALAGSAGAELAIVVSIVAAGPGPVRGTGEHAALARARVRVVDKAGVVGDGHGAGGARGGGDDRASAAAAIAAAGAFADARPPTTSTTPIEPGALVPAPGEVLIRIVARDREHPVPWTLVRAIRDRLALDTKASVVLRRLSAREIVIASHGGATADKLARSIKDLERKVTDTTFQTKVAGDIVDVKVSR